MHIKKIRKKEVKKERENREKENLRVLLKPSRFLLPFIMLCPLHEITLFLGFRNPKDTLS